MGKKYLHWRMRSKEKEDPRSHVDLRNVLLRNRDFAKIDRLDFGDHGLRDAVNVIGTALREGKKIALYADYDVDGTMSAVSWIWFFRGIGFENYVHYIPCRFREGYGVNLNAVKHLIHSEGAQLIITMDTGITANEEAAYCRAHGVEFICTDHHKIQQEKMPDCIIVNPKLHPDPLYQELCGCGVTFVVLRRLAEEFNLNAELWNDLVALAGIATICDVVPLNGVNHRLARLGVAAMMRSQRKVFQRLRQACALEKNADEKDIGFRVGPRINAVGRLDHADAVVSAFIGEDPEPLVRYMEECNERRRSIQQKIVIEADALALRHRDDAILCLGGDWHPGVVGIAASKIAEKYWRPTWLFQRGEEICKGSARSIAGFDVTDAMSFCGDLFMKFGGHRAAGGFSFERSKEDQIRQALNQYGFDLKEKHPELWQSYIDFDCGIECDLVSFELLDILDELRPFGHGFDEPRFFVRTEVIRNEYYRDKYSGEKKHSVLHIRGARAAPQKVVFFNEVLPEMKKGQTLEMIVTIQKNIFRGEKKLDLYGIDWRASDKGFIEFE